jgi:indole-3-glycerol phosphate synthase
MQPARRSTTAAPARSLRVCPRSAAESMSAPGSLLERMAAASRQRAQAARAIEPEAVLRARAFATDSPPAIALDSFSVIAELKLRSPALGTLADAGFDIDAQLEAYAAGGAAAVSVLTEPDEFHGSLSHLEQAARALKPAGIPVMRKDFLTEPYQIFEARAAGAGGVLVIAAMLTDAEMAALVEAAAACELFVLLEAFDDDDVRRIGDVVAGAQPRAHAPLLVGVNSRNLHTLGVEFDRFAVLAPALPHGPVAIAESGIDSAAQIQAVVDLGYGGALVGSALMQTSSPSDALRTLIEAGRRRKGRAACS